MIRLLQPIAVLLVALSTATLSWGQVTIDEATFPDANFRKYLTEQEYGKDGTISAEEIASVTKFAITDLQIASLKGIEHFTALLELDCARNQIKELDLSKNPALQKVYCGFNGLTKLNVSNNPAIRDLYFEHNALTEADLSSCTALTYLVCNYNQLTKLILPENSPLNNIDCGSNKLTEIDFSKCPSIIAIGCYMNELTKLDVSKNALLQYLCASTNKIKEIRVPKVSTLPQFYIDGNQIYKSKMGELIESLYDFGPGEPQGTIFMKDGNNKKIEGNICTKEQIAKLKAKGWQAKIHLSKDWVLFEGDPEPAAIDDVLAEGKEIISIYRVDGTLLAELEEGVNIVRLSDGTTRKVLVK